MAVGRQAWKWRDARGVERDTTIDALRAGLASGAIPSSTPVRLNEGPWRTAGTVPELAAPADDSATEPGAPPKIARAPVASPAPSVAPRPPRRTIPGMPRPPTAAVARPGPPPAPPAQPPPIAVPPPLPAKRTAVTQSPQAGVSKPPTVPKPPRLPSDLAGEADIGSASSGVPADRRSEDDVTLVADDPNAAFQARRRPGGPLPRVPTLPGAGLVGGSPAEADDEVTRQRGGPPPEPHEGARAPLTEGPVTETLVLPPELQQPLFEASLAATALSPTDDDEPTRKAASVTDPAATAPSAAPVANAESRSGAAGVETDAQKEGRATAGLSLPPRAPKAPRSTPPPTRRASPPPASLSNLPAETGAYAALSAPVALSPVAAVGMGALFIALTVVAFFAGRASVTHTEVVVAGPLAPPSVVTVPAVTKPAKLRPCGVARQPKLWAPEAARSVPFEIAERDGAALVGYARDDTQPGGVVLDVSTGKVTERFTEDGKAPLALVAPVGAEKGRFLPLAKPAEGGWIRAVTAAAGTPPLLLGATADGGLVALDASGAAGSQIAPADGEGEGKPPDALRARTFGARGAGVVMRRAGSIRVASLGADQKLIGALARVPSPDAEAGKPSVAYNGAELAVVFAARANADAPWRIRVGLAPWGQTPTDTRIIELPSGGPGGDAFTPDLVGLADGRWLLVWTEGSEGSRAVRAQTLTPQLEPLGDPIALSPPAGNFGQSGLGVVGTTVAAGFLQRGASGYELWGTLLQCGD
jgi:hypothetical protein